MMKRTLAAGLFLAACTPAAMAEPYPFEGRWDCEVGEFTFTDTTYDPGGEEMQILDVAQDGDSFVLTFADDYQIGLDINPDGTMQWFSAASGDSFTCRPLP
jgi:hypothetical protein